MIDIIEQNFVLKINKIGVKMKRDKINIISCYIINNLLSDLNFKDYNNIDRFFLLNFD